MTPVVARFRCNEIVEREQNKEARFSAINRMDGDNANFTKYTPSGNLQITIDKDAPAASSFTPGKTYNLTFTEYEEAK